MGLERMAFLDYSFSVSTMWAARTFWQRQRRAVVDRSGAGPVGNWIGVGQMGTPVSRDVWADGRQCAGTHN